MIDTLVIVIHDRFDNLVKWFAILKKCNSPRQIVVIHNYESPQEKYKNLCEENKAQYIHRKPVGFDIGAFQDVCRNRLREFPEWKQLLWCTDDTFPMDSYFSAYFKLDSGDGVVAMEISPYVREHIRTTGFSISKQVAEKLTFPADPITTKQHCYLFEHRDKKNTFLAQVKRMGLGVRMAAPREKSPMFDVGYHRRQNRDQDLEQRWGFNTPYVQKVIKDKVTIICPVYNSYPEIISSMICQTHKNWEMFLIHNGPNETGLVDLINVINDDRIKYSETSEYKGNWGHHIRQEWIPKATGDYILITNDDNHHTPVFLEYLVKGFADGIIATYCSEMVHNYKAWQVIPCSLKRGYIDCAGVLVRADAAKQVGWNNITEHSADWFYFEDIIKKFGPQSFVKVRGCLLIHN